MPKTEKLEKTVGSEKLRKSFFERKIDTYTISLGIIAIYSSVWEEEQLNLIY